MTQIPRILIAATGSGVGKTLITCGILQALKNRGLRVNAFKCGPDYIDPMYHKQVIGANSGNLDSYFLKDELLHYLLEERGKVADISVIEGVMGYYDGIGGIYTKASAYEIAVKTKTPVVLIVNCKGMSISSVAMIKGFLEYKKDSQIVGVILNQISKMMYLTLKPVIEEQTGVKVFGYVPKLSDGTLSSRHLGLLMPHEINGLKQQLQNVALQLEESVDIESLIQVANHASFQKSIDKPKFQQHTIRVAIASDEAFSFIYEDNIRRLKDSGVEIVYFSPLRDSYLPNDVDGMLLYGGYPELYLQQLSENRQMKQSIQRAIEEGMPCIAECGGFMYLQQEIKDDQGKGYPMVGILEGICENKKALSRFGYIEIENASVYGVRQERMLAHEFHYFDSNCSGTQFLAKKPLGKRSWRCGIEYKNLLAGYPHFYYYGNDSLIEAFFNRCEVYQQQRAERE